MSLLHGYFSERTLSEHNKLCSWPHFPCCRKCCFFRRWFLFPSALATFLIHETDLHFNNNSKCESSNPTGESFTTADTSKGLVDATTLHWAVQELRPGVQACEPASTEGLMVSTGQACQAWCGRAVSMLPSFCCNSASFLQAC